MFRADCARASSCLEDRGAGRRREDKGPEVLVHLAGLPADAVAVPAPVQPERDRGRVADIRAGALAHTRHIAREQVLNLKLSGEQRRLVDEELKRRGLPGLEEDEARGEMPVYDATPSWGAQDTQGDLDNRKRKFGALMQQFRM